MHISKKAAPPPYLPTIMLLHTLEVLTPVSYCIMQSTQHIFAYDMQHIRRYLSTYQSIF
jgi:hypothetical protein